MKFPSKKVEELLCHLSQFKPKRFRVAVMPDFFLDHLISWDGGVKQFSRSIFDVTKRKGGSIDNVPQVEVRGGNAVNTAAALAVLSVDIFPIIHTSKFGLNLLKLYFQPLNVDFSHVKANGRASITTALEFGDSEDRKNVMLRDLGSLQNFGSSDLEEKDYALLEKMDYVCVFNWAGTRRHGTELAKTVFCHVKKRGLGRTYYDTADPLPNRPKIPQLVEEVLLCPDLIDVLSLNENEAITYAKSLSPKETAKLQRKQKLRSTFVIECARLLAQRLSSRIDLHTNAFSATFTKHEDAIVPSFKVKTLRATGAGDAWNAGNIYADANDFPTELRLMFANAVAAYYLRNPKCEHPQVSQLRSFLKQALSQGY